MSSFEEAIEISRSFLDRAGPASSMERAQLSIGIAVAGKNFSSGVIEFWHRVESLNFQTADRHRARCVLGVIDEMLARSLPTPVSLAINTHVMAGSKDSEIPPGMNEISQHAFSQDRIDIEKENHALWMKIVAARSDVRALRVSLL